MISQHHSSYPNGRRSKPGEFLPEAVEAEAAAWIARLHNTERSTEDNESFKRWLSENPLHKVTFEGMTDAWEAAGHIKSDVFSRLRLAPLDRRRDLPGASSWFGGKVWAVAAAFVLAALGILFYRDSGISTGIGERRDLTLPDGSRVTLNTDTQVTIKYDEHRRIVELKKGEAFFDVAPRPAQPFIVKTADSEITALGTSFSVRSEREKTEVTLIDGKVAVTGAAAGSSSLLPATGEGAGMRANKDAQASAMVLTPGQRLTLTRNKAPQLDQPVVEKVTAWRQGLIALDKTPLADAIAEMNRYSDTKLEASPDIATAITVSGIFHAGDSADFARGLASSHGLKITQDSDTIRLARD